MMLPNKLIRMHGRTFECLLLALAILLSGCQSLDLSSKKFPWEKEETIPVPEKIMAVWTEAVHNQTGKPSERGFGGRLMFYDAEQKAIKVEGKVTIFVFDDQREDLTDPAPKYRFIFPANVLEQHFSKSDLGPSYSFWIPLVPVDAPTQPYSLVAKLDGNHGETVLSSLTRKALTGRGPLPAAAKKTDREDVAVDTMVSLAEYQERDKSSATTNRLKTETIELTPSFAHRLQQSSSAKNETNGNLPSEVVRRNGLGESTFQDSNSMTVQSRFGSPPAKSPAPNEPAIQPTEPALRRQPHRGGWLSGLPPTPRSGFRTERPKPDLSKSELSRQAALWFQKEAENQSEAEIPAGNSVAGPAEVD